jgi:hypothetical protein
MQFLLCMSIFQECGAQLQAYLQAWWAMLQTMITAAASETFAAEMSTDP